MAIRFIDLDKPSPKINGNGYTEVDGGPKGGGNDGGGGDVLGHEGAGCCVDGSVRRVQSKCCRDTGRRIEPLVVHRCGGTDEQNDLYKKRTPETVVRR